MDTAGTSSFLGNLFISKRERAFLENLQPTRRKGRDTKVLAQEEIERKLDDLCRVHGDHYLNNIRDESRSLALALGMNKEFKKLNQIISAILATHSRGVLKSEEARARSVGESYEPERIERFRMLFEHLQNTNLRAIPNEYDDGNKFDTENFFEAYFSNYIEGTRFEVEEAREIVFEGKIPENRPEGHDVLGTYRLLVNRSEMDTLPRDAEHLIELLKHRHKVMLSAHTQLRPGEFKEKRNRAGTTSFVEPNAVRGTLLRGYEFYELFQEPLKKALYMMFLVAEVHPFDDGNGRMARLMMNSVLYASRLQKIIVPNVYREDYMGSLRTLTRNNDLAPFVKAMMTCLQFTSRVDFSTYERALADLKSRNAFLEPYEGRLVI